MKTELLITGAIMLTAMAIPLTCTTSPSLMEASAAQEAIVSSVDSLKTETMDTIDKAVRTCWGYDAPSEEQTDCDVVIDSMSDKSSKIDEGHIRNKKRYRRA